VAEALGDPQIDAREMIVAVDHAAAGHLRLLGVPIKLSATPGGVRSAPPTLGQHTGAVLRELGVSSAEIDALRAEAAI
jgi:crotonobetainyl-CoA:carnitine CoA-transferase CaiB-like acyl-CoA transferase